jgi:hypothetical protein
MNAKFIKVVTVATGLLVPVAALAQPVLPSLSSIDDSSAVIQSLERQERMDELEAKFWSQEPITQQDYYVQENQDRQLIAKISAGESVTRDEIVQALQKVDTDY